MDRTFCVECIFFDRDRSYCDKRQLSISLMSSCRHKTVACGHCEKLTSANDRQIVAGQHLCDRCYRVWRDRNQLKLPYRKDN
jgi:hypothetical protein